MATGCGVAVTVLAATLTLTAQAPQTPRPAGQPPAAPRGPRGLSPREAYPDRPPADPEQVARGRTLYGVHCTFCHGADTRGGEDGPSLLRSSIVLDDQQGELIAPVVQNGRIERGMPKFNLTTEQVADIAAFVHTFRAAGYDESRDKPPSIVVGDASAGEAFFKATCASCHSTAGDLRGIATKIADPTALQQTWLMPGSVGGRGGPPPMAPPKPKAAITLASGETVEGTLDHLDDFLVSITTEDGTHHAYPIHGSTPAIRVHDPLQGHRDLLPVYTDADIHNVTAFLVTLK